MSITECAPAPFDARNARRIDAERATRAERRAAGCLPPVRRQCYRPILAAMLSARVSAAISIYAALGAVAWLGCALAGRNAWHLERTLGSTRLVSAPAAVVIGLAVGAGTVAVTRWIARSSRWGRALTVELQRGLAGLDRRAVPWLALSSALGEELLFRGAVQASLVDHGGTAQGLLLTALLFGGLHVPWNKRLLPWTIMAFVMGLVFGLLYLGTGELLAPLVAHATINDANLRYLIEHQPPSEPRANDRDRRAAR